MGVRQRARVKSSLPAKLRRRLALFGFGAGRRSIRARARARRLYATNTRVGVKARGFPQELGGSAGVSLAGASRQPSPRSARVSSACFDVRTLRRSLASNRQVASRQQRRDASRPRRRRGSRSPGGSHSRSRDERPPRRADRRIPPCRDPPRRRQRWLRKPERRAGQEPAGQKRCIHRKSPQFVNER